MHVNVSRSYTIFTLLLHLYSYIGFELFCHFSISSRHLRMVNKKILFFIQPDPTLIVCLSQERSIQCLLLGE